MLKRWTANSDGFAGGHNHGFYLRTHTMDRVLATCRLQAVFILCAQSMQSRTKSQSKANHGCLGSCCTSGTTAFTFVLQSMLCNHHTSCLQKKGMKRHRP